MRKTLKWIAAAVIACCTIQAQAQMIKTADLEKYAKSKYGEKWLDAAVNLAKNISFDKNESITYQEVIEVPGKTKEQLYVALNYWATATFRDKQAITLNDKESGTIIISSTLPDIVEHTGGMSRYSVSITPIIKVDIKNGKIRVTYTVQSYDILRDTAGGYISGIARTDDKNARMNSGDMKRTKDDKTDRFLYDEKWEITKHYPFIDKDFQKRTCAKALVMTHAYSNVVLDKISEAVKNGLVGNEDDEW